MGHFYKGAKNIRGREKMLYIHMVEEPNITVYWRREGGSFGGIKGKKLKIKNNK
jgi:hypothetical protein